MKAGRVNKLFIPVLAVVPLVLVIGFTASGPLLERWYAAKLKVGMSSSEDEVLGWFEQPRPLPRLDFVDGQGDELTLDGFKGKVVLLNIWATWCFPCRKEMPALDRLQARLGGEDFEVVPISTDEGGRAVIEAFYEEVGVKSLGIYWDQKGQIEKDLDMFGYPTTFLLDREGRALSARLGPAEWDSEEMIALIQQQITGQLAMARQPGN